MKGILAAVVAVLIASIAVAAEPAFRRNILQRSDVNATQESVLGTGELAVGGVIDRHSHHGIEMTYVLEGEVELTIDGETPLRLKAGDSFIVPSGKVHAAKNIGEVPGKLVGVWVVEKGKPLAIPAK
jgi:quercetin dioxygenase-like cupin family protein